MKKTFKLNKKGFTLIELLAVIIILGVLMIIAIPSVTTYISNSRKSSYIDTVRNMIGGARTLVNSGKLDMYDTTATYYLPLSCVGTENGLSSPYGEFEEAYVVVTYNGDGYDYYFTGRDSAGMGIKTLTATDDLDIDDLEADVKDEDIKIDEVILGTSKVVNYNDKCTGRTITESYQSSFCIYGFAEYFEDMEELIVPIRKDMTWNELIELAKSGEDSRYTYTLEEMCSWSPPYGCVTKGMASFNDKLNDPDYYKIYHLKYQDIFIGLYAPVGSWARDQYHWEGIDSYLYRDGMGPSDEFNFYGYDIREHLNSIIDPYETGKCYCVGCG